MAATPEPLPSSDSGAVWRRASNSTEPAKRNSFIDAKTAVNQRHVQDSALQSPARKPVVIVRKKLPWLDRAQQPPLDQLPGQFKESKESLAPDSAQEPPPVRKDSSVIQLLPSKRASASSLNGDPALRATGSTPSLRKRARSGDFKSLSLNSQPRPGVKPVNTRRDAKRVLRNAGSDIKQARYTSSEYSYKHTSDSREDTQDNKATKVVQSPPRLARRRTTRPREHQGQFQNSKTGPQSRPDPPSEQDVSPREHSPSRRNSVTLYEQSQSQCEPPTRPPRAKTMQRHSVAIPSPELPPTGPPPPPPRRLTKKSTLYAMPTHLLPSPSNSSASPRAPSSTVSSSPPPPPPPRAVTSAQRADTVRDGARQSPSLNLAVSGLENLLEEALDVARSAAQNGRDDEVANILDNATLALRKASTVHGEMRDGRMSRPLVLSPVASEIGSDSETSIGPNSNASSIHSKNPSIETAPTLLTKSAQSSQQPLLFDRYTLGGQTPQSRRATLKDVRNRDISSENSVSLTPPRLYEQPSADSIVRDFAYARDKKLLVETSRRLSKSMGLGAAAEFYGDDGQSVVTQPGVRASIHPPMFPDDPPSNTGGDVPSPSSFNSPQRPATEYVPPRGGHQRLPVRRIDQVPTSMTIPPRRSSRSFEKQSSTELSPERRRHEKQHHHPHLSQLLESSYYRHGQDRSAPIAGDLQRDNSTITDTRYDNSTPEKNGAISKSPTRYSGPPTILHRDISLKHPRRKHISLREGQGFSLGRYHRRQPIAREWNTLRKRITATIACINTVFIGLITGIYAGEVPRMQYQLGDETHKVILGNVLLFATLGLTTLIFWPLPLLHGRKPYTLIAFACILPLLFPQALAVQGYRNPSNPIFRCGLLIPRVFKGVALGFANINFLPTLFDLFGASLMSEKPHQEIVVYDDVRRQGGGVGVWLGIWSFCFVGSMSVGFSVGAAVISNLDPSWGFYIIVILLAFILLINVIAPETRRSPYRRSIAQYLDGDEKIKRRVARGEVKLHISNEGPKWWFQEVGAGLILVKRMVSQFGFFILMLYLAWMYAQVTLVILLLGALLTRDYKWQPQYVSAATLSMAIGALLAVPLSKANLFSRARDKPQRTDSMTMRHGRVTWSSHMLRRCIFTLTLPCAAIAYTLASPGPSVSWTTPTIFAGFVGFLSNLAIAECVGLIMETFDTCDLQPGVNSKHRLQSMAETTRRRRTNYSSFPRICAGFFAAQSLGFLLAAAATGVSGDVTRAVGAQTATAIVAATLLMLTVLFIIVLWRWKEVQVIPNGALGTNRGSIAWGPGADDPEWKPVVIGNPSGKMRRVNLLELGSLSRWTEIRKLNKLIRD